MIFFGEAEHGQVTADSCGIAMPDFSAGNE
jgi:hypothetical protein